MQLPGNVVRQIKETGEDKTTQYVTALEFDALPAPSKEGLEKLLAHYSNGLSQSGARPEVNWAALSDSNKPDEDEDEPEFERRSTPRKNYGEELWRNKGASHQSLIGKNLSLGGMRIEPRSGLVLGDTLRLAFFAAGEDEPFTISARVTRHDAKDGTALQFDPMSAELEAMLEQLITGLPPVEVLQDGESEAMGAVLAEILPD
ncbi:MAG: PilZ domain-containing protein [Deltaproteobacteria bacterium]|nr:PilZ domain-containing protein [Deltaproteobacteria bacterium]